MDIETLTQEELAQLATQIYERQQALLLEAQDEQTARTGRIEDSIQALESLLGPIDGEPGIDNIRAIRKYDALDEAADPPRPRGTSLAENAGLALSLLFEGLEINTAVVRDIATTIAHNK